MSVTLPAEFSDLQPLVKWAIPTEYERMKVRRFATSEELKAFYDVMLARMPAVLETLDSFPLNEIPASHSSLMHMAMSLAEVAPHVELYKLDPNVPYAFQEDRLMGPEMGIADD